MAMDSAPQKLVHWALDVSISDFGSPCSEASSSDSGASTSSLQYINSQLVAHGFTPSPGLSCEGLSNPDIDKLAKCLLAMLGQRVDDMSRAEDLSTKIRTLSYDHERLLGMHRSATEKAANAERETNLYKSRLATASKALTASESAHKQTSAELQRTRSSLIALRATYSAELKKKEKDMERIVEKWSKLSDVQTKLSTSSSGLTFRCGNADVGSRSETLGKGKGYLEIALEQAESARASLSDETLALQRLVVSVANRLQSVLHELRCLISPCDEEPALITHSILFSFTHPNAANDKFSTLFSSTQNAIEDISKRFLEHPQVVTSIAPDHIKAPDILERQRLQDIINELRLELEEAKKLHDRHGAETQALLMQVASQASCTERDQRDVSVDIMSQQERNLAAERLEGMKTELDEERRKFTNAAVRLGKEKAALEVERIQFLEEKRSWQVEQMLSDLPPTPVQASQPASQPSLQVKSPPRKSPMKPKVVGKINRKTRISRRSSSFSIPPPSKMEPAYETEVIPVAIPSSASEAAGTKSILMRCIPPSPFVLPPRSPRTSLPPVEAFFSPVGTTCQLPSGTLYASTETESASASSSDQSSDLSSPSTPACAVIPTVILPAPLQTPAPANTHRLFPLAKPLAPHMSHAYSPAKPSPLSRILMLANSPDSLDGLSEESEDSSTCPVPVAAMKPLPRETEPDDSPLREKKTEQNVAPLPPFKKSLPPESKPLSTKDKAKAKSDLVALGKLKPEKENRDKIPRKPSPSLPSAPQPKVKLSSLATAKPASKLPAGKGGARRVLIGSAEAAPQPGWRG